MVPHFRAAMDTARVAAARLPYRLAGWDVAIAPDGPILIEGNNRPDLASIDLDVGGSKGHPDFACFLRELGLEHRGRERRVRVAWSLADSSDDSAGA